ESRGLKGLSGFLIGHLGGGEFAQLCINEREQFIGRLGIALLNAVEDARDVAHKVHTKEPRQNVEYRKKVEVRMTNEGLIWQVGIQTSNFVIGISPGLLPRFEFRAGRLTSPAESVILTRSSGKT